MQNHKVRSLIIYFVSACLFLTFSLSVSVIVLLNKVTKASYYEHQVTEKIVKDLNETRFQVVQIQQYITDSAATGENDGLEDAAKARDAALAAVKQLPTLDSSLNQESLLLETNIVALFDTGLGMVKAYRQSQDAGNLIMKDARGFDWQSEVTIKTLDELTKDINVLQAKAAKGVVASIAKTEVLTIVVSLIILVLVVGAGYAFYRILLLQLGAEPAVSRQVTEVLMEGDLSSRIPVRSGDKHSLLYCLSIMKSRWTEVILNLRRQASLMASPAEDMHIHADELAASAALQSKAASSVFENVEQLSINIDRIANEATNASRQLIQTGAAAEQSAQELNSVVSEINKVSDYVARSANQVNVLDARSQDIVGIVAVIKGIADQTNLLALNAAIEAARAGESGRGFAVVADEVRTLAQRVAESTKTITDMVGEVHEATREIVSTIDDTVKQVSSSVEKSKVARISIERICVDSAEVCNQVSRINDALHEQRTSGRAIANSMSEIAAATEKNNAASADLANAAKQLHKFSSEINNQSSYFKLEIESNKDKEIMLF